MPGSLLDAMHVVYEECAESCQDRMYPPMVHPIECFRNWLQLAEQAGWTPPRKTPSWSEEWPFELE